MSIQYHSQLLFPDASLRVFLIVAMAVDGDVVMSSAQAKGKGRADAADAGAGRQESSDSLMFVEKYRPKLLHDLISHDQVGHYSILTHISLFHMNV